MNKLTHKLSAKIIAVFLITLVFVGTLITAGMAAVGVSASLESGSLRSISQRLAEQYLYHYVDSVATDYYLGNDLDAIYGQANFTMELRSATGELLWSNHRTSDQVLTTITRHKFINHRPANYDDNGPNEDWVSDAEYNITLFAKEEMTRTDTMGWMIYLAGLCVRSQVLFIVFGIIGILLFMALLVFLFCSAGRQPGHQEVVLNRFDRIPFDLLSLLYLGLAYLEVRIFQYLANFGINYGLLIILAFIVALDFLLLLAYVLSLATRIKAGQLLRNTLVFILLRLAWRFACAAGRACRSLARHLPVIWKTLLVLLVVSVFNLAMAFATGTAFFALIWLVETLLIVPYAILAAISLRRLQSGARRIVAGDLASTVELRRMPWSFRSLAADLNSIRDGLSAAVDERLRSERFKTELITNVSHDLKTPLTSIINYVGLLQQENLPPQTIQEYVGVLDRQSTRLKKLTDDLFEVSKASTGSLAVDMAPADAGVLLAQTAGEYSERLEKLGLELVLHQPDEPVMILADGRHLWRIFDNLLNNICKYAQPATRVYLSLDANGREASITFRNISREPLNLSGEELIERFVRGDASRNTEGSGLGLAIASSLAELMKASMTLSVDGDLFKVVLVFSQLKSERTPATP